MTSESGGESSSIQEIVMNENLTIIEIDGEKYAYFHELFGFSPEIGDFLVKVWIEEELDAEDGESKD